MTQTTKTREAEECRLERTDGSTWIVTDVGVRDCCFHVTAHRPEPNGGLAGNGGPERDEGSEADGDDPSTLRDEPLDRGDRLVWLNDDGEVVWSARCPVGRLA